MMPVDLMRWRLIGRAFRAIACCSVLLIAAARAEQPYTVADFARVRKFDAHVHANTDDRAFLKIARKDGFEILSINVDYPDFPPLREQARVAHALQAADPRYFHFATTFSMKGFGKDRWTQETNQLIDSEIRQGALAVKVWKNIGMVEKDAQGRLIMLDDPGFDVVMAHIEAVRVPLIAHQAEPKNCWLSLDAMITENDRSYFREHPEYYMYLHPEQPSYESLIAARDRFVARHPRLSFVGAHLGSLEWSIDALATFLDTYPNATVDLAARMTQVQYQSKSEYEKVRRFFIEYQDRVLYGSDLTQSPVTPTDRAQNPPVDLGEFPQEADAFWRSDWTYLATSAVQHIDAIEADVKGLALPKRVVDKIYYKNARRVFGLAVKGVRRLSVDGETQGRLRQTDRS
jgi:predicted TIM-barrel fold metal-dependent hydrolase